MYGTIFIQGFGFGFAIAAIVGPISLLCIRNTLTRGQIAGIAVGLGAALADTIYGFVAGLGITVISDFVRTHTVAFRLIGGSILIIIGLKIFLDIPSMQTASIHTRGFIKTTIGTFFLTLSSPFTIMTFLTLFLALGLDLRTITYNTICVLVGSVFMGSMTWWTILTSFLRIFHTKVTQRALVIINKCSGAGIAGFGILIIISLFIR